MSECEEQEEIKIKLDFIFFEVIPNTEGIYLKDEDNVFGCKFDDLIKKYSPDDILTGIKKYTDFYIASNGSRIYFDGVFNIILYYKDSDSIYISDIPIDFVERATNETALSPVYLDALKISIKEVEAYKQFSDDFKLKLKLEYDI